MTDIQLYKKISELSPDMKNQISNYIDYLKKSQMIRPNKAVKEFQEW